MKLKHSLKTAYRGLEQNRARSILTILGIVIGVTAIILVMSLGQGAQNLILDQVEGMGTRTIIVGAGREPTGPSDAGQIFSDSLKRKDLELLERRENTPSLRYVVPIVFGVSDASYLSDTFNLTIFGTDPTMEEIFDMPLKAGSFFTEEDVRARAKYVVIGNKVKTELFGADDALGKIIKMKGHNFRVVGIIAERGQDIFNFDEAAIIPYTTAQDYILGIKYFNRFLTQAQSEELITEAAEEIKLTLRESHDLTRDDKDDFFVVTQVDLAGRLSAITSVLTIFLAAVAAISLIVGGIGIMNIMLVSVTERTKEIGLRKALGATYKNILTQFLLEAVILTGMGGIVGILLGAFLSWAISAGIAQFTTIAWTFSFPVSAALLGLGVSGIIGLVFGLYPARAAARKSPIDALRYE
ncbi:MAG: ABC transporter permease [Candidatus Pacebacteria bacterium]|jgi:putative ABC transport system permease protein|nr:ABC transporter permease [Candidatus Paceibacterota bacterium]